MKLRMHILGIGLVAGLLLVAVTSCDWFWKTPTPTATPAANIPVEVLAARDAALVYLRHAYPGQAPPEGINWTGRNITPPGLVGASAYEFTSSNWLMTVRTPIVAPSNVIYEMELSNQDSAFRWTGKLNASYTVVESNLDVAVEVLVVRDMVLSYVREHYADQAPAESLAWIGERTTPEGSIGHESCRFTANNWIMTVAYDVVRPDQVVYQVELRNSGTEFMWRGQVDAQGAILEHR